MKVKVKAVTLDQKAIRPVDEETVTVIVADGKINRPIIVRHQRNGYRLVDGLCRLEAARRLGLTEIEATVVPHLPAAWQRPKVWDQ